MKKSNLMFYGILFADFLLTIYVFSRKNVFYIPPPYAYHLLGQLYILFFIILTIKDGGLKRFCFWSFSLMIAHLFAAALTFIFKPEMSMGA